jgi:hypothetical protein
MWEGRGGEGDVLPAPRDHLLLTCEGISLFIKISDKRLTAPTNIPVLGMYCILCYSLAFSGLDSLACSKSEFSSISTSPTL